MISCLFVGSLWLSFNRFLFLIIDEPLFLIPKEAVHRPNSLWSFFGSHFWMAFCGENVISIFLINLLRLCLFRSPSGHLFLSRSCGVCRWFGHFPSLGLSPGWGRHRIMSRRRPCCSAKRRRKDKRTDRDEDMYWQTLRMIEWEGPRRQKAEDSEEDPATDIEMLLNLPRFSASINRDMPNVNPGGCGCGLWERWGWWEQRSMETSRLAVCPLRHLVLNICLITSIS